MAQQRSEIPPEGGFYSSFAMPVQRNTILISFTAHVPEVIQLRLHGVSC